MANLYEPPSGSRVFSSPAPGDLIDVVNWPSLPSSPVFSTIPADTLLVMPFYSNYILNYDAMKIAYTGTTNTTWGLYSYEPSDRSGALLDESGGYSLSGTNANEIIFLNGGTIYPGRTYAVVVNSSSNWDMVVFQANGVGCARIIGFDWVGSSLRNWTHLRTPLTYDATLPPTLPSLVKNNSIWPPNPLFRSV